MRALGEMKYQYSLEAKEPDMPGLLYTLLLCPACQTLSRIQLQIPTYTSPLDPRLVRVMDGSLDMLSAGQ